MAKKRHRRRLRPEKRRARFISTVVMVIAACVFLYAAYNLFLIFSEYNKGDNEYQSLEQSVISIEVPQSEGEEEKFKVDFETLKTINSDVLGWIRFENPEKISYPVVAGIDNDVYLHTTFEGKYNAAGTLFVDMDNANDFSDRNTFIHGHNMKNGSMFGQLRKYQDEQFGLENPYFYIYTPDGREVKYQVFAVCVVTDTSNSYDKTYADDAMYLDYIRTIRSRALYDVDILVEADDKIVSLSTCTNVRDEERLLVHGVVVSERMIED